MDSSAQRPPPEEDDLLAGVFAFLISSGPGIGAFFQAAISPSACKKVSPQPRFPRSHLFSIEVKPQYLLLFLWSWRFFFLDLPLLFDLVRRSVSRCQVCESLRASTLECP
jgi:hypothetical protein